MSANWYFARQQPGIQISNTLSGEHFNQGAVGDSDWQAGESLVREAIQNSLDARAGDEAVSVVFHVSAPSAMTADTAAAWFGSLWPHLRAHECKLPTLPSTPTDDGFIVVEDFGTHGLKGDTEEWHSPRDGDNNDFFSFFRAEGLSGKTKGSGGSWGVGKSVFNRCSRINTFLAVTVRRPEQDALLIGKTLLWQHYVREDEFLPIGQFGVQDATHSDLVLPAAERDLLMQLARDFSIRRPLGGNEGSPEPGLSVVIPYSDPEITAQSLLSIVVREYFQPILAGRLCVQVSGHGLDPGVVNLDRESIRREARALGRPELDQLLALADWARIDGIRAGYSLADTPKGQAPRWDESLFRTSDPRFKELCQRFERGEPVSFCVPMRVSPTTRSPQRAGFKVFLQRDLNGRGYRPVFVRAGLVVPNVRERAIRGHDLFALVTIDDGPLAEMLRAAEPPAHTTWSHETARCTGFYKYGKQTIEFVVGAPKWIADVLSSASTERDVLALADFFPDPGDQGRRTGDDATSAGKKTTKRKSEWPERRPKPFRIDRARKGFRVVRDNREITALPLRLEIMIAYDTSRGNALAKYHEADFRLPELEPKIERAEVERCDNNCLEIAPKSDDFCVEVEGFDENRDLYVKVHAIDVVAPEGAES